MHKMEKQQTNHALMQHHDGTRADEGIEATHTLFYTYQTRTLFQSLSDDEKGGRGSNKQRSTNWTARQANEPMNHDLTGLNAGCFNNSVGWN